MFDLPALADLPDESRPTQFSTQMAAWILAQKQYSLDLATAGVAFQLSTSSTSTTSASIGVAGGSLSMNLGAGKGYVPGMLVMIAYTTDPTKAMLVRIITYTSADGSGTQKIVTAYGSGGPYTAWTASLGLEPTNLGKQAIWVPARAWLPRTTLPAALGSIETTTNKVMAKTLDFDASTIEYAQFDLWLGTSWNAGTITAIPVWSHGSTTTNFKVSWGLQAVAFGDNGAIDTAFGTAIYSNDTGGTTDREYIGPETTAITISNTPAEGKRIVFQTLRKADDATNDTLAVDARLHGWVIYITIDAGSDA
jgi:hypothetical protein